MKMCLPTPRIERVADNATFTYSGARWLSSSYWANRAAAMGTASAAHAISVAAARTLLNSISPGGCTPQLSDSGPFENIAHQGWWSGSGTITLVTQVIGLFVCDTVPDGESEYTR